MGITPNFTKADIAKDLMRQAANIHKAIIRRLQYLGEQCLIEARTNRTYQDQTGNLTSSMGYVIVDHGTIITTVGFEQTLQAAQGQILGESLARQLAAKYTNSYALIVVAGMHYAAAVESRGKNVLSSAEMYAESEMPKLMARLKKNIENG